LITSQVPIAQWHDIIADPTLGDAILDRIVHNAHRVELKGDSLRRRAGEKKRPEPTIAPARPPRPSDQPQSSCAKLLADEPPIAHGFSKSQLSGFASASKPRALAQP
jgi:hypothetical protein